VTFVSCAVIGDVPAISETFGFQMRARKCSIIGCTVLQAIGRVNSRAFAVQIYWTSGTGSVIRAAILNPLLNTPKVEPIVGFEPTT
jgi:hypothetical protein